MTTNDLVWTAMDTAVAARQAMREAGGIDPRILAAMDAAIEGLLEAGLATAPSA